MIIVARGGGSLEDLWGFNDEALARTVAASGIPVISAVGHETDWTLIDYAADVRAPTPTGAAEFAVPVKAELEATVASLAARLKACTSRNFERKRTALRAAARALPSPDQLLALPRRRFDEATSRLGRALTVSTERKRARLMAVRLTPAVLSRRIGEAKKSAARDLQRAQAALRALVRERRGKFDRAKTRLSIEPIARRQKLAQERLSEFTRRGDQAVSLLLERGRTRLDHSERLLATLKLSDQSILDRGYALVIGSDGKLVKRAAEVTLGAELTLEVCRWDGKSDGRRRSAAADGAGTKQAQGSGQPGVVVLAASPARLSPAAQFKRQPTGERQADGRVLFRLAYLPC